MRPRGRIQERERAWQKPSQQEPKPNADHDRDDDTGDIVREHPGLRFGRHEMPQDQLDLGDQRVMRGVKRKRAGLFRHGKRNAAITVLLPEPALWKGGSITNYICIPLGTRAMHRCFERCLKLIGSQEVRIAFLCIDRVPQAAAW
jgi:hypothetical protein